ncbi:ROK family transcriptional regulator [Virgibacillus sp. NKC19-3]|uniref:ROK family transcriptional regulator n=1 Tax=Virgibacillus saliphilus TaxID=2831674 RepID=UPI001C9A7E15|nr:ROK family transcriptional regulator [Virgibacillus sp. NKC19-3]MBY7142895.1 ROK family transcriptional regulator [Virgibacillus sp. NKC19-3]
MTDQFVNGNTVKQANRSFILKDIRQSGPITKIDLARKFDLTFSAVGNIITEFSEAGLIKEAGYGESSGGRPPVLYEMKWDSVYVIALVIGVREISACLVNLKGEVSDEIIAEEDSKPLIERVYNLIDQLLERIAIDISKISGIGVSAPGPIDTTDGKMLTPPNLEGVRNISFQRLLEDRYKWPTILEKDANAFALAEQWFGDVEPNEDILYIYNDQGLGGGLIIDSRIHRGIGNGAGEIGHMVIDIDGPKCNCGNFGCLETLSSGIAIQRRVKEEIRRGYPTSLADDYLNNGKEPTIENIVQQAEEGDKLALEVLHEAERYLGLGLANAINLFAPDQVIFGGMVAKLYPKMINTAEKIAKERALSPYARNIIFAESAFNHQSNSIGAASVIHQKLFDYPEGTII